MNEAARKKSLLHNKRTKIADLKPIEITLVKDIRSSGKSMASVVDGKGSAASFRRGL